MRQVGNEERELLIAKLSVTPWGERPLTPHNAVRGDKQTGEADRVLPASHKSAEPVEAGRAGTSAPVSGPACESAKERETEPMADAPVEHVTRRRGSGRVGRRRRRGCSPSSFGGRWSADPYWTYAERGYAGIRVPAFERACGARGRNSHGVKSAPKADERSLTEPENLTLTSPSPRAILVTEMIEATDDREDGGRSPRSSPRAGKPPTWQRGTVGMACKQEVDTCPTR